MPVEQATNAILHPWLKQELTAILDALPDISAEAQSGWGRHWADWGFASPQAFADGNWPARAPDLDLGQSGRALHAGYGRLVSCSKGILLLYTPLGGSWLNMAETIQRIMVRRALAGQHPQSAAQIMEWLAATVRGWNADPTPFEWGGKRWQRRQRFRERHKLGGSRAFTRRPVRRRWQSKE